MNVSGAIRRTVSAFPSDCWRPADLGARPISACPASRTIKVYQKENPAKNDCGAFHSIKGVENQLWTEESVGTFVVVVFLSSLT
jgi:hypothetical protein